MPLALGNNPESSYIERVVMFPGQGPDPRLTGDVPDIYAKIYKEVTGLSLREVRELDDGTAYSGTIAQPLHILRLASYENLFNYHLEHWAEDEGIDPADYKRNSSYIPASLSEYLMNYICGSWDFQTALEVAKKRGELSDEMAKKHPGEYGMLATFYRKALSKDEEKEDQELSAVLASIIEEHGDELEGSVFFGSHPSPSMVTLSGKMADMKKIEVILKEFTQYKIGATSLERINGAYHSLYMAELRERMAEFITVNVVTTDPDPSIGAYFSPTSLAQVKTKEDVIRNASDLIVKPVDQIPILNDLRARLAQVEGRPGLMVLEFGNSRNHKWGKYQGVQTTCLRDYRIYHPFTSKSGAPIEIVTLAFDGNEATLQSDELRSFIGRFAIVA